MLETAQPETAPVDAAAQPAQVDPAPTDAADFYREQSAEGAEPTAQEGETGEIEQPQAELEPIEAPPSWAKDAKDVFATLPREAQEIVAKRERERDLEVRRSQNEVGNARQQAEREARAAVEQHTRSYAEQLEQYAQQFMPQQPDIRLLHSNDPQHHALYHEQDRQYRIAAAQQGEFQQRAAQAKQHADALAGQQHQEALVQKHQEMVEAFPEWADPAGQANLIAQLEPIAAELGYSRELMAHADASDFKALQTALNWKADAEKYRELMKRKMEPVRAAKQIPPTTRAGAPSGQAQPASVAAQLYPNDVRR